MTKVLCFFLCALLLATAACSSDADSIRTLQSMGFTDIQLGGHAFISGCAEDDLFYNKFTAKNPQGRQVSGVVCCGILKSCTGRF